MIFDKEGKIVTVDAPRPSDPEFKSLIEQTLESNNEMKFNLRNIFATVTSLIVLNTVMAQQDPVILSGVFTEKIYAELILTKNVNNRIQKLGEYTITPSNPEFVFAFPADTTITYSFQVKTLKQGHMRLEADKYYTLPLTLKPGRTIH
jgi:hypothetical protein